MSYDDPEVKEYMARGMTYRQACKVTGVEPLEDIDMSPGNAAYNLDDEKLIELNGSLAIRAIYKALTNDKIDNTLIQAAIRAVQMLEDQRSKIGSDDPEDDMLRWVAEVSKRERESRYGE